MYDFYRKVLQKKVWSKVPANLQTVFCWKYTLSQVAQAKLRVCMANKTHLK